MMDNSIIFYLIEKNRNEIKHFGVQSIGLFGSYIRNEQQENSDIDFLVEFSNGQKNIHNLVGLGDYLEHLFGKKVELVTRESLSKYIGPHILNEVKYASISN